MKSGTYVYSLLSRLQREGLSMKWLQGKNRDLSIIILSPDLTEDGTCLFRYGTCWTKALEDLESGCKNLDDEMQSRCMQQTQDTKIRRQ